MLSMQSFPFFNDVVLVSLLMCFVFSRSQSKLMFLMLKVVILTMNSVDSSIR